MAYDAREKILAWIHEYSPYEHASAGDPPIYMDYPNQKEPVVPVQVATVEKTTLQRTVTAEAVLFPLQQSAIVPKISAPVKAFYVKRGSRVRKGHVQGLTPELSL